MDEKDKSKKTKGDTSKVEQDILPKTEQSETDNWRSAERNAQHAERTASEFRAIADELGSGLAKKLIESHKGKAIDLDGQMYTPKARAIRKLEDGTTKAPKLPFQLVKYAPKSSVEI